MAKLTYYTATTLDGFIADPDDSLAWLFAQGGEDPDEATRGNPLGYEEFIRGIGAIVMGPTRSSPSRHRSRSGPGARCCPGGCSCVRSRPTPVPS